MSDVNPQCLYHRHNGIEKGSLERCIMLDHHEGAHEWKRLDEDEVAAYIKHSKGG